MYKYNFTGDEAVSKTTTRRYYAMKKLFFACVITFLLSVAWRPMVINGEVVYDLTGEWDATFNCSVSGIYKEIIKITQNDDQFVGIRLSGDKRLHSNEEEIRGKVKGVNISEIKVNSKVGWLNGDVKVSEGGNKIVIQSVLKYVTGTLKATLLRK